MDDVKAFSYSRGDGPGSKVESRLYRNASCCFSMRSRSRGLRR